MRLSRKILNLSFTAAQAAYEIPRSFPYPDSVFTAVQAAYEYVLDCLGIQHYFTAVQAAYENGRPP